MKTVKTWDISGMGGGYEKACQKMLWAGMKYFETLKNPKGILKGRKTYKNIYGICDLPDSFAECEKAMLKAVNNDCTGAMMQAVTGHLRYIAENGYEQWFEFMKSGRGSEQPTEFEWDDEA